MDCQEFERRFEELLEGRLPESEAHSARAHLSACESCRELYEIAEGNRALLLPEAQQDLTHAIMQRTSGPACRRAETLLCDFVDQDLPSAESELVSLHLDHCSSCRSLADALIWMRRELPEMAELQPATGFVAAVLSATARQRGAGAGIAGKLREIWQRWLIRPRFTWEAAYVFTVLLGLIVSIPNSPAQHLPPKTLTVLQGNLGGAFDSSGWQPQVRERLSDLGQQAWQRTGLPLAEKVGQLTGGAARRYERVQEPLANLSRHGKALRNALAERNVIYAAVYLRRMGGDLLEAWRRLWQ